MTHRHLSSAQNPCRCVSTEVGAADRLPSRVETIEQSAAELVANSGWSCAWARGHKGVGQSSSTALSDRPTVDHCPRYAAETPSIV
jgi:hypothetical protein